MTEAGRFTERITIEENSPTRSTAGVLSDVWTTFAAVWAYRRSDSSRETTRARLTLPELQSQFVVRGPLAVTNAMRVIHGTTQYEILGVETEDGKVPMYSREIVLNCRAGIQMKASS